jgi:Nucleotidyl transferase AbiEii toxin, Type IV TA system
VAGEVRLFEHPDFEPAMLRAAEHHGLSEQFIEKDYYINEILRIAVGELGEKVVFKGGTSLSKGWGSLLARYLKEKAVEDFLTLEDIDGFDMHLLHFRRTFVEKMFALHGKVERLLTEDHPLGRDARHYSDLHVLADQHEVRSMLASTEFEQIRLDYDERSRQFFPKAYRPPPELSFKDSPALFPDASLRARLEPEYEAECALLFSDQNYASFDQVLAGLTEIRALL